MGNCCDSPFKEQNKNLKETLFYLVKSAVHDWFVFATTFEDLPKSVRSLLSGDLYLTCDYIVKQVQIVLYSSLTEESKESKVKNRECLSLSPYWNWKKAVLHIIQWFSDIVQSNEQISTTIFLTMIQIIECEETSLHQEQMDHIRISALKFLEQYSEKNLLVKNAIKEWQQRYRNVRSTTTCDENSSILSEEREHHLSPPKTPMSLSSLMQAQGVLGQLPEENINHLRNNMNWTRSFTDPLPSPRKKSLPLIQLFPPLSFSSIPTQHPMYKRSFPQVLHTLQLNDETKSTD